MLIAQRIDSLTGGVSQQPAPLRDGSQAKEILNAYLHPTLGCLKRPPTVHVAQLDSSLTGYGSAFLHLIDLSPTERYKVVVVNGDLKVFDALTGSPVTVSFPDGKGYLAGTNYRAATLTHTTVLVDTDKTVAKGTSVITKRSPEALVTVQQADYATSYIITLNNISAQFITPPGTTATARAKISTDSIAQGLAAAIAATSGLSGFIVTQLGSTLHLTRSDGSDFTIASTDGLADQGLATVKDTVQRFEDLPPQAPDGTILQVLGDIGTETDDYWVVFRNGQVNNAPGTWQEYVKPGEQIDFDYSTTPHILEKTSTGIEGAESAGKPKDADIFSTTSDFVGASIVKDSDGSSVSDDLAGTILFWPAPAVPVPYRATIPAGATTVRARFLVDYLGSKVRTTTLTIEQNTAPGNSTYNIIAQRTVSSNDLGFANPTEVVLSAALSGSGDRVRVSMVRDDSQNGNNVVFILSKNGNSLGSGPGVAFSVAADRYINFGASKVYANGSVITVTVNGTPVNLTLSSDQTGAQVAASLQSSIDALSGVSAVVTAPGIIKVRNDSGGVPTVSYSDGFSESTTFHNPSLALTPSSLVGKAITNRTDGSTGIITANTSTTVTVSSLTGGSDNKFEAGDICDVAGTTAFVFKRGPWLGRKVGTLVNNPYPGWVGKTISEVFFHRGRLGFAYENSVSLSQTGNQLNFFRTSVKQILDGDPIDARSIEARSRFHSALAWNETMLLFTAQEQAAITGDPLLTPKTIKLPRVTAYPNATIRPATAGRHVYFAAKREGYTQVHQWGVPAQATSDQPESFPVTKNVPQYLLGSPRKIVGWAETGMVFVLTDSPGKLYVRSASLDQDGREINAGWNTWTFTATILDFDVFEGVVALVMQHADGVYLETLTLG